MRSLLCLHGSGGSAAEWARISAWARASSWELAAIDAPAGNGKWWTYPPGQRSFTASSYTGAEESIQMVEAELIRGKHSGVIGFSQGAMLAAIVAARCALGESATSLRCAVICAAAMPKPYEPLLHRLRDAPDEAKLNLPTLHTLCATDPMNPSNLGEEVANCFAPSAEILWHGDGHALPPLTLAGVTIEQEQQAESDGGGGGAATMDDVAAWLDKVAPL